MKPPYRKNTLQPTRRALWRRTRRKDLVRRSSRTGIALQPTQRNRVNASFNLGHYQAFSSSLESSWFWFSSSSSSSSLFFSSDLYHLTFRAFGRSPLPFLAHSLACLITSTASKETRSGVDKSITFNMSSNEWWQALSVQRFASSASSPFHIRSFSPLFLWGVFALVGNLCSLRLLLYNPIPHTDTRRPPFRPVLQYDSDTSSTAFSFSNKMMSPFEMAPSWTSLSYWFSSASPPRDRESYRRVCLVATLTFRCCCFHIKEQKKKKKKKRPPIQKLLTGDLVDLWRIW